ncbi:MAG: hypothetical protein J7L43_02395 [Candidatus Aenigmarchaeota archaeon]|nr:hypothetical protein [Candidatus Aenigmarchaeota archaeon]
MRRKSKLDSLNKEERKELIERLYKRQGGKSYISGKEIDLRIDEVEIDHIVSLDRGGIDNESNWGLVLKSENRSKGNRDLQLMRYIYEFRKHREKYVSEKKDFAFGDALNEFYPTRHKVKVQIENGRIILSYKSGENTVKLEHPIITDERDKNIKSFVGMLPFEILHHDPGINPRSIVDLEPMIEEFYNKNPQLFPSLALLEMDNDGNGKIMVFDGQHKAAAQLYVRSRRLFVRVFINADRIKIKRTNFRAHTILAQIHFPQLISDKVGHDLFKLEFEPYLEKVDWDEGSEASFLKTENISEEYRRFLSNWLKYRVLMGENGERHKILDYVETVSSRSKKYPLSYDTLSKTFLKLLFLSPANEKLSLTQKYREMELKNLQKLMEIFVEEVLNEKFDLNMGIYKLEEELEKDPNSISDEHLIAYRMCRAPAMVVWITELKKAISRLLKSRNKYYKNDWSEKRILWAEINDEDWKIIRNMIKVMWMHQVWKQKENKDVLLVLRSTRQKDWKEILLDGRLPGREERLFNPLRDTDIYDCAIDMR